MNETSLGHFKENQSSDVGAVEVFNQKLLEWDFSGVLDYYDLISLAFWIVFIND
jgi:hypothetical protein